MRLLLLASLVFASLWTGWSATAAVPEDFDELVAEGERYYAEASFTRSREAYLRAAEQAPEDARRWVAFRLADTRWRSAAASNDPDTSELELGVAELQELLDAVEREEDRDRVWAEVQESIGDYQWTRRRAPNFWAARPHYTEALDWWAGSADLDLARDRWLAIVFRMAHPAWNEGNWSYGDWGNRIEARVLLDGLTIAREDADVAQLHYLLARTIHLQGDGQQPWRVGEHYEECLEFGRDHAWYDDALFGYAAWMESSGSWSLDDNGQWKGEPDYVRALELYRRFVREFGEGESRHGWSAESRITDLVGESVGVHVSSVFLPGSERTYTLTWRNVEEVELALIPIDLTEDVDFDRREVRDVGAGGYAAATRFRWGDAALRWSHATGDEGRHVPGRAELAIEGELADGAYLLVARAGGAEAREVLLASDAALVLRGYPGEALVWTCAVTDGEPVAGADVTVWERWYQDGSWRWARHTAEAGEEGLARVPLRQGDYQSELFAAARRGNRQAFAVGHSGWRNSTGREWKVYATTDRSAYRPDQLAQWKLTVRSRDGGRYETPAGDEVFWRIVDPRGTTAAEGSATLNAFGSTWGELETTEQMPLGAYRLEVWRGAGQETWIGGASLFQLEEYKLPEFEVAVRAPEEGGVPVLFRTGDEVRAEIDATYFFGGPVSDASVEVLVHQRPYFHTFHREREYPWLYADEDPYAWTRWYGAGTLVQQSTVRTDADGHAVVAFPTQADPHQDFEYVITARVTDASRREVESSLELRVTRQGFFAELRPEHNVVPPGDRAAMDLRAADANGRPVAADGRLVVTRESWVEVWRDEDGQEHTGRTVRPENADWVLVSRGYEKETVDELDLATDAAGEARYVFTAARDGYYRFTWTARDAWGGVVRAQGQVFATDDVDAELGYRPGDLELVLDEDTVTGSGVATALLTSATSNRWVLFTVGADELFDVRVLHMTGNAKLIRVPIDERHQPNAYLEATGVSKRGESRAHRQLVVPPVEQFLDVVVETDAANYLPGGEAILTVEARDAEGRPVETELSVALVDAAVSAIVGDQAGDPRPFFWGQLRQHHVYASSSFQQLPYRRLVEGADGKFVDELVRDQIESAPAPIGAFGWEEDGAGTAGNTRGAGSSGPALLSSREAVRTTTAQPFSGGAFDSHLGIVGGGERSNEAPAIEVRTDFRETALWLPSVLTGADGRARVEARLPESLTRWEATARGSDRGARVGMGTAHATTSKPLTARLQAPRFFTEGDRVLVSAILGNASDVDRDVHFELEGEGIDVLGLAVDNAGRIEPNGPLPIPAGGQLRMDWFVEANDPGLATLRVRAWSGELSDGMERSFDVVRHGIRALEARSGRIDADEARLALELPAARDGNTTSFAVQVAPSLAVTMLDALPYLVRYPYGCTEQTLSRFVPAVVVARTLDDRGLAPELAMARVFGGIELEHVEHTQDGEPVSLRRLDDVVERGLDRLVDFQHADGGWSWWKRGESDPFMTAYAVWGLALAYEAGVEVPQDVLDRGAAFLDGHLVGAEQQLDLQAWMLHALGAYRDARGDRNQRFAGAAFDNLWASRASLNAYARALLTLSAVSFDRDDEARILAENLVDGVIRDDDPESSIVQRGEEGGSDLVQATAHWGEDGVWRRWSDGGVEATAFALRALLAVDPDHELVQPVTNWLVRNRRGSQWSNTRDTAICVLALNDFLDVSGELGREVAWEVEVNGTVVATEQLGVDDLLRAPRRVEVDLGLVRDGRNDVVVRRTDGEGPLYVAVYADFFTREEPIPPRGSEIFVRRQYYRLAPKATLLRGTVYERVPLEDGDVVASGERVEVVLTVEAKNHYEYLLFEDLKPAGLEATRVLSGDAAYARELKRSEVERRFAGEGDPPAPERSAAAGPGDGGLLWSSASARGDGGYTGRSRWLHQELRDDRVAFFVDRLPQGVWEIRYDLRAEVPGAFHALPTLGHAMYVPEIRCNGAEQRVVVADRDDL